MSEPPLCSCGTLAVGKCKECGAWKCGDHSGLWEAERLCSEHYGVRLSAYQAAAAKANAERQAADARMAALSEQRTQEARARERRERLTQMWASIISLPLVTFIAAKAFVNSAILQGVITGGAAGGVIGYWRQWYAVYGDGSKNPIFSGDKPGPWHIGWGIFWGALIGLVLGLSG